MLHKSGWYVIVFGVLLGMIGACVVGSPTEKTCKQDADCPKGEVCKFEYCAPAGVITTPDSGPPPERKAPEKAPPPERKPPERQPPEQKPPERKPPACEEGKTRLCKGPDKGICKPGKQTCKDGEWTKVCEGKVEPKTEECNNEDDNCDGKIDETFPEKTKKCNVGQGLCEAEGNWICTKGKRTCNAKPKSPQKEVCNGKDDDCNGKTDEIPECGLHKLSIGLCAAGDKFQSQNYIVHGTLGFHPLPQGHTSKSPNYIVRGGLLAEPPKP